MTQETLNEQPYQETEQAIKEIRDLEPLEEGGKVKGITVCHAGTSRSVIMRSLLEERGYDVKNYGVSGSNPFGAELVDAIERGEVQFIACADEEIAHAFKERFKELSLEKGKELNVPIRYIDLPEGPGIGWWRHHRDTLDKPETYDSTKSSGYYKEDYDNVVEYTTQKFDKLGFKDRS